MIVVSQSFNEKNLVYWDCDNILFYQEPFKSSISSSERCIPLDDYLVPAFPIKQMSQVTTVFISVLE